MYLVPFAAIVIKCAIFNDDESNTAVIVVRCRELAGTIALLHPEW